MPAKKSWIGKRFGKLLVIQEMPNGKVKTQCDCGAVTVVSRGNLTNLHTKSCGCLRGKNLYKHGNSYKPEYKTWRSMIDRCTNVKNKSYKDYGGRGITVCREWLESFDVFFFDMGNRPGNSYSIDRIDNNKGYSKINCRWATRSQQQKNKRAPKERSGLKITGPDVLHIKGLRDICALSFVAIGSLYHVSESTVRHAYYNR